MILVKLDSIHIGLWIHSEIVAYHDVIKRRRVVLWPQKLTWYQLLK